VEDKKLAKSQEPGMVKKRKIEAPPTNIVKNFVKGLKIDARQCQGASQEVSQSVVWSQQGEIAI